MTLKQICEMYLMRMIRFASAKAQANSNPVLAASLDLI